MSRLLPALLLFALLTACGAPAMSESAASGAAPVETLADSVPEELAVTVSARETETEPPEEMESAFETQMPVPSPEEEETEQTVVTEAPKMPETVYAEIGGQRFSVTLDDSPTAEAFRELLPAVWDMEELHGNEKFVYLDGSLPSDAQSVGDIETGDLMLYGDSCVVLFYDSFSTSYGYTRIGWVDDPAALPEAVGGGDITVSFYAAQTD